MALVRLRDVLDLGAAPAELHGGVAVPLLRAHVNHLQLVEMQHGDGHVGAVFLKQPGHPQLLCDESGAHHPVP